jgi:hypothetical protein
VQKLLVSEPQRAGLPLLRNTLKRPRVLAPALHTLLFVTLLFAAWRPGVLDIRGPIAGFAFWLLIAVDLPFSYFAFALIWSSAEAENDAAFHGTLMAWAVLGALWWFLLGCGIEAWRRRRSL